MKIIAFIGSLTTRACEQARRRLLRRARNEDGQALVELALVIPVLLLVLLAIVDFGRAINYWNDENYLANLGARFAAVGVISDANSPCSGSKGALVAYLVCEAGQDGGTTLVPPNGVTPGQPGVVNGISVCVNASGGDAVGTPITVKVSTPYDTLPFLTGIGPTLNLSGTATMRVEQPASAGGLDITTGSTGSC